LSALAQTGPGVLFDLRVRETGGKEALVTSVGQAVNLDVYAYVYGANNTSEDDGLGDSFGMFRSSTGGLLGNLLTLTPPAPFNLSHSGGMGLIGWARDRELGVDVERWRELRDEAALVRRFFSQAEIAAYEALPEAQRRAGFFRCWTRKEAYVKAVGRGLGLPLHSFDVNLEQGDGARLLRPSAHCVDGRCWSLAAPEAAEELSLAVVLEADAIAIRPDHDG
jgi:hypothetical protein